MLLGMEQAGMKSLPLGKIDLHTFSNMNPYEKGHLENTITACQDTVHTVGGLVALLQLLTLRALVHGMLLRWGSVRGHCGHGDLGCESVDCEEVAA